MSVTDSELDQWGVPAILSLICGSMQAPSNCNLAPPVATLSYM